MMLHEEGLLVHIKLDFLLIWILKLVESLPTKRLSFNSNGKIEIYFITKYGCYQVSKKVSKKVPNFVQALFNF